MEILKLQCRERAGRGKGYTRKTRADGWIPAVFYGEGHGSHAIEVKATDFAAIVRGRKTTHLIDLGIGGEKPAVAIIKEIQRDVLKSGVFHHVDFQIIDINKKVTVTVPITITGVPTGVRDEGGVLEQPVRSVMVECMPMDIPERITVDVSALAIGDALHVRDVTVPDGLAIKESLEEVIAVVHHPAKEAEPEAAAEGEGGTEGAAEGEPAAGEGKDAPTKGKEAPVKGKE